MQRYMLHSCDVRIIAIALSQLYHQENPHEGPLTSENLEKS